MKNIVYLNNVSKNFFSSWIQTSNNIYRTIKTEFPQTNHLDLFTQNYSFLSRIKRKVYRNILHKEYLIDRNMALWKSYSKRLETVLKDFNYDLLITHSTLPIAFLNIKKDVIFWTDASFAGMVNFYPGFTNLCSESIKDGNEIEERALNLCKYAIYTSDWAANSAVENYGIDRNKVYVIPYGPNLDHNFTYDQIKKMVLLRSNKKCRLIFVGVEWHRKGGDIVIEILKELNRRKFPAELVVIGGLNESLFDIPNNVIVTGFLDNRNKFESKKFQELFASSHFFVMPSRAECTGIVFSEANNFAVPVLGSNVGGIPTIIKDNINGKIFSLNSSIQEYANYITTTFSNYDNYIKLAMSSYNEFVDNLSCAEAGKKIKKIIDFC